MVEFIADKNPYAPKPAHAKKSTAAVGRPPRKKKPKRANTQNKPKAVKKRDDSPAEVKAEKPVADEKPIKAKPDQNPKQKPAQKKRRPKPAQQRREPTPAPKQKEWQLAEFQVEQVEGKTRFHDLNLPVEIMHAVADLKFEYCTPIQAAILPIVTEGKDACGKAQTGTGKTAAFLIASFTRFLREPLGDDRRKGTPRALILAPTRELATQIGKEANALGKHCSINTVVLYGGIKPERQIEQLKKAAVDLIVATPGRLLDFQNRRQIHLGHVETLIIDEADRMLDMGFIPDVRKIIHHTPSRAKRQTMLFSATLTPDVIRLASQWMREDSETIEIEPEQVAVDTVNQRVYIVTDREKFALLYNVLTKEQPTRTLIFANRRDVVARLTHKLKIAGFECAMISGALPQNKRETTLKRFRAGEVPILIAT